MSKKGLTLNEIKILADRHSKSTGYKYYVVKLTDCKCYDIYRKNKLKNIKGEYKVYYTTK